jgi:hypothetical protein
VLELVSSVETIARTAVETFHWEVAASVYWGWA